VCCKVGCTKKTHKITKVHLKVDRLYIKAKKDKSLAEPSVEVSRLNMTSEELQTVLGEDRLLEVCLAWFGSQNASHLKEEVNLTPNTDGSWESVGKPTLENLEAVHKDYYTPKKVPLKETLDGMMDTHPVGVTH
jgi:hypothetical protein